MVRLRSPSTLSRVEVLILKSFAKLNLFLEVLKPRQDNYHNIKTIFERINLYDTIILKIRPDRLIKISCDNPTIPSDQTNLVFRSAKLLQDTYQVNKGVEIKIIKRLPVGSGMGGGSANAAGTLLGLNKLWKLKLTRNRLVELGKKIGCDVPFFLFQTPFALGSGRGDEIKPIAIPKDVRLWHIVVVPRISVSTPLIYKKWDALPAGRQQYSGLTPPFLNQKSWKINKRAGLTRPISDVKILTSALRKNTLFLKNNLLFNSLEAVTISLYPQVERVKERLRSLGLKSILMSGSGPAVFGIVASRKEALLLAKQLKRNKSWQVFIARTF